jgi:hypothetical protein
MTAELFDPPPASGRKYGYVCPLPNGQWLSACWTIGEIFAYEAERFGVSVALALAAERRPNPPNDVYTVDGWE